VQRTLVDTGPLVALFNAGDHDHGRVRKFLEGYRGQLVTTWLVVAEVHHLLDFSVGRQLAFLAWARRGGVQIEDLDHSAFETLHALTEKYQDRPMDLADASLMVVAMSTGIRDMLSLDIDFDIYRLPDRKRLRNLLPNS
jgi:predicted nucleic acid-binding protein